MAFTPKLTYKGKPLVRKDNELYYGNTPADEITAAYKEFFEGEPFTHYTDRAIDRTARSYLPRRSAR